MSLLHKLLGRKMPRSFDSELLREQLFHAVAAGDQRAFEKLCRKNVDQIVEAFEAWHVVPAVVQSDPVAMQRYSETLISVADYFAESLGRRELLDLLVGTPEINPITKWQDTIAEADKMMDERRYRDAAGLLRALLPQLETLRGPTVGGILATAVERLGSCQFHLGETELARAAIEKALSLCEEGGDIAGIASNLKSLYEIHRFFENSEAAADCAARLASLFDQYATPQEGERWRRQAQRARRGEPLCRVVIEVAGERYELDDLTRIPAGIEEAKFVFERNRQSLGSVEARVQEGRKLGAAGQLEEALDIFQKAARVDPHDPDPHYQAGMTLVHLQRYKAAAESYEQTERLAPGWFHCRSELWLAKQLATGQVSHASFLLLRELEDGSSSHEEKVSLAREALNDTGKLALPHLLLGENLLAIGKRAEAKAAFLKGLSCAGEQDVETRLLLSLANVVEPGDEKERLLRQAVALNGNLVSAAAASLLLRHHVQ